MRSARGDQALEVVEMPLAHIPGAARLALHRKGSSSCPSPHATPRKPSRHMSSDLSQLDGPVKGRVVQRSVCLDLASWPPWRRGGRVGGRGVSGTPGWHCALGHKATQQAAVRGGCILVQVGCRCRSCRGPPGFKHYQRFRDTLATAFGMDKIRLTYGTEVLG